MDIDHRVGIDCWNGEYGCGGGQGKWGAMGKIGTTTTEQQ